MSTEQQIETPQLDTGADPDAAKYEALRKELEQDGGAPQPEPEPPPEPEPEPEPEPDKAKPTYEDLERNYSNTQAALKQARDEARQERERLAHLMRIVEDARAARPPKPDEPKLPDVQEDPIGHFQGQIEQLRAQLAEATTGTRQTAQQLEAQRQEQQFWGAVQSAEDEFKKTTADYDAACEHLALTRIQELQVMLPDDSPGAQAAAQRQGFRSPAELRGHLFSQDRIAVAVQAVQLGVNPAQLYYSLAKQRGYAPANGALASTKGKVVIDVAKRGRNAATTISGGGGGRKSADDLSLADLADLAVEDPEAFDKMWDKMAAAGKIG